MSDSAQPDPQRSGVYRSPSDVEPLRRSVHSAIRWIDLSLRGVGDKAELMQALAEHFGFAATFGANWDALADALQDTATVTGDGCLLHLTDSGMALLPDTDRVTLADVLSATAAYWRGRGKTFVVLVDGATELPLWT